MLPLVVRRACVGVVIPAATKATVENIAKGVTASMIMYPQLSDVNYKEWKRTCVAPVGFV